MYKEGTWLYNTLFVGNEIIFNLLIAVLDLSVLMKPKISQLKLGPVLPMVCVSQAFLLASTALIRITCHIEL